jgi:hypothetical protein
MADVFAGGVKVEEFVSGGIRKLLDGFVVRECQICGGFPPPIDETALARFNVDGIYARLYKAAETNLVCASELSHPTNSNRNDKGKTSRPDLLQNATYVDNVAAMDTGFVYKTDSNLPDAMGGEKEVDGVVSKYDKHTIGKIQNALLTIGDKTIVSVHLPGDGPKAETKSILQFLTSHLPPADGKICGIFGDTNITTSKTLGKLSRKDLIKEIAEALAAIYGGTWVVIMSDFEVLKMRFGFALPNHQLKKSEGDPKDGFFEADGTIFAYQMTEANAPIPTLKPNHSMCVSGGDLIMASKTDRLPIFSFATDVDGSVDATGMLVDDIFLDHSVLQFPASIVQGSTGMDLSKFKNIVALNMGSVVNSVEKDWNTKYAKFSADINATDKEIYEYVTTAYTLSSGAWPAYVDIKGSEKSDPKSSGLDMQLIVLNAGFTAEIVRTKIEELLGGLYTKMHSADAAASALERDGGKRRRKTMRKKRNKTNKSNSGKKRRRSNKRKPKSMKV